MTGELAYRDRIVHRAHLARPRDARPPRAMACGTWVATRRGTDAARMPADQRCRRPGCAALWARVPTPEENPDA